MRRATSLAVAAPARIHATASVSRAALLKSGVHVGPWCNVGPGAVLEEGVKLKSHVSIRGPVWVGRDAVLFPHVRIEARGGGDPLRIGERTLVREHARILEDVHVGPGSLLLADCELRPRASVGKHVVLSNKTVIGESANVEDFVGIGGAGVIGDGVCVGKGSFVGGHSREEADVLPHSLSMASKPKGLNIVGLSRRGMSHQTLRLLEAVLAVQGSIDLDAFPPDHSCVSEAIWRATADKKQLRSLAQADQSALEALCRSRRDQQKCSMCAIVSDFRRAVGIGGSGHMQGSFNSEF